jgi:hypothetical protein
MTLTIELNDTVYELSEEMKRSIEQRAESAFEENHFLDYYWTENERSDPVLSIETEGKVVPWDRLERLEFEEVVEQEQQQQSQDDDTEKDDVDSGSGVKSVPKDDVDMSSPDPTADDEEGGDDPDTKFMVTHPSKHYVPQPDDDDPEKLPPDPDELPEDPTLVSWIPDSGREEVWSTGKALVPTNIFIEWNIQLRADEVPDDATKMAADSDGGVTQVRKTHNHDEWEKMAEMFDCEVVEQKPSQETPSPSEEQQRGYSGKEADEDAGGAYGGDNWQV